MPSSLAVMETVPSLIRTQVASRPSAAWTVSSLPSIWRMLTAWMPSSAALIFSVPPVMQIQPSVSSSSFSACRPSLLSVRTVMTPPQIAMESFASMP